MKIAILVKVFPPTSLGGTETATLNIANHLAKNHDVSVITIQKNGFAKEEIINNFKLFRLLIPKIPIISHKLYFLKILLKLKKLQPDIIHAQMLYSEALFGVFIKKLLNKPFVVYPRGVDIYLSSPFYKKIVIKFILKNSEVILAQTENMKKELRKVYRREVIVIPNGTEPENYIGLTKENCRKELKINKNEKIILYVGRLVAKKCIEDLILATKELVKKEEKVKLFIVGAGEDKHKLESLTKKEELEDFVEFKGKIPNEIVPKYIVASDIFALVSYAEGYPMVFTEVLPSGIPIITSNDGANPEIIEHEKNGLVVELHNISQIVEAIRLILNDEKLRQRIFKNNIEKAQKNSWENIVKRLENVYKITVDRG